METLALAAVSLTIALSILLKKKRSPALLSYAVLCLALFVYKLGDFLHGLFPVQPYWAWVEEFGLLLVSPALANFTRSTLTKQSFITGKTVLALACLTLAAALSLIWPWQTALAESIPLYLFAGTAAMCYAALLWSIIRLSSGIERWRMVYVAIACAGALLLTFSDLLDAYGYPIAPLADIAIGVLIYFMLVILVHQDLPELYLIMARMFVVFLLTVFGTAAFFLSIRLFGKGMYPPFTTVLMAAFLIVIFIDPLKIILKKIFSRLFSGEGKEILTSLYTVDGEAEKQKSVLLEEMGTVLAHEIRNPLGSIKGAAQLLRSEAEDPDRKKLLEIIIEESDRLNVVVSQFLSYARPFALTLAEENINKVVEKAISIIAMNHLADGVAIEKELHQDLPAVMIDKEQIMQVILNIALNGIEAMPAGGRLIFRTTRIDKEGREGVGISIRDTGRGMDKDEIRNIFKPFFTTKKRGIGVGLAVSSRIIKNHKGRIRVKSIPGQGSVFYITLEAQ